MDYIVADKVFLVPKEKSDEELLSIFLAESGIVGSSSTEEKVEQVETEEEQEIRQEDLEEVYVPVIIPLESIRDISGIWKRPELTGIFFTQQDNIVIARPFVEMQHLWLEKYGPPL